MRCNKFESTKVSNNKALKHIIKEDKIIWLSLTAFSSRTMYGNDKY